VFDKYPFGSSDFNKPGMVAELLDIQVDDDRVVGTLDERWT
jgi:hypothetical protein